MVVKVNDLIFDSKSDRMLVYTLIKVIKLQLDNNREVIVYKEGEYPNKYIEQLSDMKILAKAVLPGMGIYYFPNINSFECLGL